MQLAAHEPTYGTPQAVAVLATALAVLTAMGLMTPAVLLLPLFFLECGQTLTGPAWQALQPELGAREQIAAAAALGAMNVNVARAIGPALAGVIVALFGPSLVFAVNAVSFLGIVAVLGSWKRLPADLPQPPNGSCPLCTPVLATCVTPRWCDESCSELPCSSFRSAPPGPCCRS
ncbi:MFS transporter [Saccharopolyspora sp. NPDC050389]|uniref:MFS transporter n=1 Tax=Saccharopolyspora sp. NPDC050389 TaxID=3155516 RepID=UPI0033CBC3BA